jgi:class 3 adenylate cyclase
MATIAKNFGARIIKNAGDCLIYYFPHTLKSGGQNVFKNVIECGITMISAHQAINTKLFDEGLPPLNYRISADYGKVEIAKSSSSQTEDLFGSSMNVCAKINSKAPPNGMAIGYNLYKIVSIVMQKEYNFERAGEYTGFKELYPVYSIKLKQKRNILNPFRRVAEPIFDSHLDSSHFDRNEDNYFVNH